MPAFKDYNAELKALQQRQRDLRHKHAQQLGDLVVATGADELDPETLAGVLLVAMTKDKAVRAEWQSAGARFLEGRTRSRRKAENGAGSPTAGKASASQNHAEAGSN